ncbi:MAG: hypothetical protein ABJB76_04390 [Candidatus Nitrosocosmicus sp.]
MRNIFQALWPLSIPLQNNRDTRPADNERKKVFYSLGKKKRHTVKNQFVANNSGFIIHKNSRS